MLSDFFTLADGSPITLQMLSSLDLSKVKLKKKKGGSSIKQWRGLGKITKLGLSEALLNQKKIKFGLEPVLSKPTQLKIKGVASSLRWKPKFSWRIYHEREAHRVKNLPWKWYEEELALIINLTPLPWVLWQEALAWQINIKINNLGFSKNLEYLAYEEYYLFKYKKSLLTWTLQDEILALKINLKKLNWFKYEEIEARITNFKVINFNWSLRLELIARELNYYKFRIMQVNQFNFLNVLDQTIRWNYVLKLWIYYDFFYIIFNKLLLNSIINILNHEVLNNFFSEPKIILEDLEDNLVDWQKNKIINYRLSFNNFQSLTKKNNFLKFLPTPQNFKIHKINDWINLSNIKFNTSISRAVKIRKHTFFLVRSTLKQKLNLKLILIISYYIDNFALFKKNKYILLITEFKFYILYLSFFFVLTRLIEIVLFNYFQDIIFLNILSFKQNNLCNLDTNLYTAHFNFLNDFYGYFLSLFSFEFKLYYFFTFKLYYLFFSFKTKYNVKALRLFIHQLKWFNKLKFKPEIEILNFYEKKIIFIYFYPNYINWYCKDELQAHNLNKFIVRNFLESDRSRFIKIKQNYFYLYTYKFFNFNNFFNIKLLSKSKKIKINIDMKFTDIFNFILKLIYLLKKRIAYLKATNLLKEEFLYPFNFKLSLVKLYLNCLKVNSSVWNFLYSIWVYEFFLFFFNSKLWIFYEKLNMEKYFNFFSSISLNFLDYSQNRNDFVNFVLYTTNLRIIKNFNLSFKSLLFSCFKSISFNFSSALVFNEDLFKYIKRIIIFFRKNNLKIYRNKKILSLVRKRDLILGLNTLKTAKIPYFKQERIKIEKIFSFDIAQTLYLNSKLMKNSNKSIKHISKNLKLFAKLNRYENKLKKEKYICIKAQASMAELVYASALKVEF